MLSARFAAISRVTRFVVFACIRAALRRATWCARSSAGLARLPLGDLCRLVVSRFKAVVSVAKEAIHLAVVRPLVATDQLRGVAVVLDVEVARVRLEVPALRA